ncbi:transmembrane and TPR repeat-containing protein CG4050-like [Centruroides sculpturatus]|uniref:transmembrane and TPR repeat-containing protein CG4050-like n=1 Tax=Centruroides sculpturatus TaxID=218467 RepID=UPI000C6CC18B|nr:transmembrane and TPR repeat-containing protein CG4050-like [Centruroides sculpturatus]
MRTLLAKKAFNPQRKSQDLTFKNCLFKYKPDLEKGVKKRHYLLLVTTVCACYYNALECGFVFDDMSAVKDNKDLRPITHVSNIFWNDFWGTPIIKEHSHKSYRPICVLTFRINYMIDELNPLGYHLVNVLLHALVCILYLRLCYMFLPAESSLVAAMLFAVHPIHTEAVTGVVGRAETLSSVFFLSAFLCYIQCSQWKWTGELRINKKTSTLTRQSLAYKFDILLRFRHLYHKFVPSAYFFYFLSRKQRRIRNVFFKAKNLLPRPRPGEQYQARVAPSHLNVFLNLGNLISRNDTRLEEADSLYKQAISMRADYIQAYINRGDILVRLNRTEEAREVYKKALKFDSNNPDLYYNLGVVLLEQGRSSEALQYFDKALKLDPGHEQALMNSAILIQETGSPQLRKVAHERLNVLLQKGKASERVYFNLGMLAMDNRDVSEAEKCFRKAIELRDDFRSALFNLALLLSDAHRPFEAVPVLKQLLKNHPDHVKGLILLGDIYINHVRNLDAAKQCYEDILSLEPSNIQALHNLCVVYVERGLLLEAESCLKKAVSIAPHEEYVQRHLKIVKDRLKQQEDKQSLNGRNSSYSSKFSLLN